MKKHYFVISFTLAFFLSASICFAFSVIPDLNSQPKVVSTGSQTTLEGWPRGKMGMGSQINGTTEGDEAPWGSPMFNAGTLDSINVYSKNLQVVGAAYEAMSVCNSDCDIYLGNLIHIRRLIESAGNLSAKQTADGLKVGSPTIPRTVRPVVVVYTSNMSGNRETGMYQIMNPETLVRNFIHLAFISHAMQNKLASSKYSMPDSAPHGMILLNPDLLATVWKFSGDKYSSADQKGTHKQSIKTFPPTYDATYPKLAPYVNWAMLFVDEFFTETFTYSIKGKYSKGAYGKAVSHTGTALELYDIMLENIGSHWISTEEVNKMFTHFFITKWSAFVTENPPGNVAYEVKYKLNNQNRVLKFGDSFSGWIAATNYIVNKFAPDVAFGWDVGVYAKPKLAPFSSEVNWLHGTGADAAKIITATAGWYKDLPLFDPAAAADFLSFDLAAYSPFHSEKEYKNGYFYNISSYDNWLSMIKTITHDLAYEVNGKKIKNVPAMLWQVSGGHLPVAAAKTKTGTPVDCATQPEFTYDKYYNSLVDYVFGNPGLGKDLSGLETDFGCIKMPPENYQTTDAYLKDWLKGDWTLDRTQQLQDAGVFLISWGANTAMMPGITCAFQSVTGSRDLWIPPDQPKYLNKVACAYLGADACPTGPMVCSDGPKTGKKKPTGCIEEWDKCKQDGTLGKCCGDLTCQGTESWSSCKRQSTGKKTVPVTKKKSTYANLPKAKGSGCAQFKAYSDTAANCSSCKGNECFTLSDGPAWLQCCHCNTGTAFNVEKQMCE